jgi:histidinol-phosphate aminotransferase
LRQRLAKHSGWSASGIVAGNGSNEMIQALLTVTIGEGKRVLINEPTFALYRQLATILGADVVAAPLSPSLSYDVKAIRQAIQTFDPDVIIICSPNNPTGCVMPEQELVSLLEAARGLIIVDEAYCEFSGESVLPLLKDYSNLAILRTFSKALGLAGLRIGYLLAMPELALEVSKAVLPYNLNVFSQTAAEVAIDLYEAELKPLIQLICNERDRLYVELGSIPGLTPVASRANFMVVRSSISPDRIFKELLERGILIRDVSSYPGLKDYFRISVGTPEENEELIKALRTFEYES